MLHDPKIEDADKKTAQVAVKLQVPNVFAQFNKYLQPLKGLQTYP